MIKAYSIAVLLALLAWTCSVSADGPDSGSNIIQFYADKFVADISRNWSAYSVCEYVDRTETDSYLKKVFPLEYLSLSQSFRAKHLWVRETTESIGFHITLYRVDYPSEKSARRAFAAISSGQPRTVADGKVLTQYSVRLNGAEILLAYSQTFLDPPVSSFLREIAGQ